MKLKKILTFILILLSVNIIAQPNGKIIFSKNLIASASGESIERFNSCDYIYSLAIFDKKIADVIETEKTKNIEMEVSLYDLRPPLYDYQQPSEILLVSIVLWVSGSALQKKSLPLDIVPNSNQITAYGNNELVYKKFGDKFYGPVKFAEKISKLEPGEHTIIVKLKCNYKFIAQGQFIIDGNDFACYKNFSNELNEIASNAKTKNATMPKAALHDKSLEAEMRSAFKNSQTYKDRVKGKIIKISIIDPDWIIRRNDVTGRILHRYIRAAIAVKSGDGTCTVWQNVTFQQNYVSGNFQKTKFNGIGDPYKIPCKNIK